MVTQEMQYVQGCIDEEIKCSCALPGLFYYYNVHTNTSRYRPPPSCAWTRTKDNGHAIYINHITRQHKFTRPAAMSWRRIISKKRDRAYWLNYHYNVTFDHVPGELPQEMMEEVVHMHL